MVKNDEVLGLLKLSQEEAKTFAFIHIVPHINEMAGEAPRIAIKDSQTWSPYEKALMR